MNTRPCILCGKKILVAKAAKGDVLLDIASQRHIYELSDSREDALAIDPGMEVYVEHVLTCAGVRFGDKAGVP